MTNQDVNWVRATRSEVGSTSVWDVECIDCRKSIGTMKSDMLQAAVLHNSRRGGVKCPECRKMSCYQCGINLFLPNRIGFYVCPVSSDRLGILCKLCFDQYEVGE